MSLGNWAKNSWLKPHRTSKQEIQGLFSIVQRGLQDSQIKGLSSDGKFMHAHRASFTLATILLYSSGYAPASGQSHHYRTIVAIPEILGDKHRMTWTISTNADPRETQLNMMRPMKFPKQKLTS